jgi:hypothetical protein
MESLPRHPVSFFFSVGVIYVDLLIIYIMQKYEKRNGNEKKKWT